jgi:erythromycin esterase
MLRRSFRSIKPVIRALVVLIVGSSSSLAQKPLNLDFDMPGLAGRPRPWGWQDMILRAGEPPGTEVVSDTLIKHGGRSSLRLSRRSAGQAPSSIGTHIYRRLLPEGDRGLLDARKMRLSGWVRTENLTNGKAGLFLIVPGQPIPLFDSLQGNATTGTSEWNRYAIEIELPANTQFIVFGVRSTGEGIAWFDDLVLELDGASLQAIPTFGKPASTAEMSWLARTASTISSVNSGATRSDLAPFSRAVAGAHVVGLGEGTHGTSEFQRLKHRLLEHLAVSGGPTVFALEDDQVQAAAVNQFIQTGQGDARKIMGKLYTVTQTGEMLDLVNWMREFNLTARSKVEFVGFDLTDPRPSMDSVLAFLRSTEPAYVATAESAYRNLRIEWDNNRVLRQTDSSADSWVRTTTAVLAHLKAKGTNYRLRLDTASVARLIQHANLVQQHADYLRPSNVVAGSVFRDSVMAENLLWELSRRPVGTRVIVAGHNEHVTKKPGKMGHFLSRALGDRYRAYALSTHEGIYSANQSSRPGFVAQTPTSTGDGVRRRWDVFQLHPGPGGSFEAAMHGLEKPRLFVDFRAARSDSVGARFLDTPREFRLIGAAPNEWGFDVQAIGKFFDGVFFIDRTRASMTCPFGVIGCAP